MWWGNRHTATGPRIHRAHHRAPWLPVPGGPGSGRSLLRVGHQEDGFASGYAARTWRRSPSIAGVLPIGSKSKSGAATNVVPLKSPLCTLFLEVLSAHPADRVFAAYLKCSAEIDVSRPPYLLSSLTPEGETMRRLAGGSSPFLRGNRIL